MLKFFLLCEAVSNNRKLWLCRGFDPKKSQILGFHGGHLDPIPANTRTSKNARSSVYTNKRLEKQNAMGSFQKSVCFCHY